MDPRRPQAATIRFAEALRLTRGAAAIDPPPPGWFRRLRVRTTVWAQLYRWLRERHRAEGDDADLRDRVVIGRSLARRLRAAERARLRHLGNGRDEVQARLRVGDFDVGPQEIAFGRVLAGERLMLRAPLGDGREPWRRDAPYAS